MRARWIAGIFAVSALALATAASLAQRPERPRSLVPTAEAEPAPERKAWRSKAEAHVAGTPAPAIESSAIEPGQAADDPMVAVEAFLRRNRKEADDSIRALTLEADALRTRLAKIEAALARWQAVAGSLSPGQKWSQPNGPSEPGSDLPPIEPAGEVKPPAVPPPTIPPDPVGPPTPPDVPPFPRAEPPPTIPEPTTPPATVSPPGPGDGRESR